MHLIIDSGGTKALWVWAEGGREVARASTRGIYPYFMSEQEIADLGSIAREATTQQASVIYYYGTGCKAISSRQHIARGLQKAFPDTTEILVDTDLLGAARALCQSRPGIVCILGTGSNSCSYDGDGITANHGGFGYVLGDEASGASLGKNLLSGYLNNELSPSVTQAMRQTYHPEPDAILEAVYRKEAPNRYLAGYAPFLLQYIEDPTIRRIVDHQFNSFLQRYIINYSNSDSLPVHFLGSVAWHFQEVMRECLQQNHLKAGNFLIDPMEGLVRFH